MNASADMTPETSAPIESTRGRFNIAALLETIGPIIGLLLIVILFSALQREKFLTSDNAQVILLQTAVVAMAALGMTLIIASGGIDLSVGSAIALCTVVVAQMLAKNLSPLVAALCGVLTGMGCGLLIGLLVTRFKLTPFIVTLGLWGALRGLAKGLADDKTVSFSKEITERLSPTWIMNLLNTLTGEERWMLFPPGVWLTIICAIFVALLLKYTRFGRHIFAIGSNEATARLCGIPVENTKLAIYTFAGAFTGLAGVLQFSYLTIGDPTTAEGRELDIIAAVVIGGASLTGGQGSVLGTIVGALIMTTVANGCTKLGLANWVQQIVTGGIIIFAVALDRLRQSNKQ